MKKPKNQSIEDKTRIDTHVEQALVPEGRAAFLVQIYGAQIGHRYLLDKTPFSFGRNEPNDVILEYDNVSRHHAELARDGDRYTISDQGSTNGTFVNDRPIRGERALNSGDLVKIGGTIFKFIHGGDLEGLYYEEIYRMTIIDGLTEVHNKRYLLEFLEREIARCQRYQRPMSLILFDVDHFKDVNDTHGHIAGDYVLRHLAGLIAQRVRKEELLARYGGEEFCIVMPESDGDRAEIFAEKVRKLIDEEKFVFEGASIPVQISLGVGQMRDSHAQALELIGYVDAALYSAKRGGRNRVVRAGP